jgi:hypothetical protein
LEISAADSIAGPSPFSDRLRRIDCFQEHIARLFLSARVFEG